MHKPTTVILITGHPATGKTTLAHYLAQELGLPLLYRDGLKETLADHLGWSTDEWSLKLGAATWELLYHLVVPPSWKTMLARFYSSFQLSCIHIMRTL